MGPKARVTKGRRPFEGSTIPDIPKLLKELQRLRQRVLAAEAAYPEKPRGRPQRRSVRK
jgi:hypothetical protein